MSSCVASRVRAAILLVRERGFVELHDDRRLQEIVVPVAPLIRDFPLALAEYGVPVPTSPIPGSS
jgi:hypothetical protein